MPDLLFTEREQTALQKLLAAEPVTGRPLPAAWVLELIDRMVPCDSLGVCLADDNGHVVESVSLRRGVVDVRPEPPYGEAPGPRGIGFTHWLHHAEEVASGDTLFCAADAVAVGFRNGPHHVSQILFKRTHWMFSEQDLARIRLLVPVLKRLLRERPTPSLPAALTVQERRVLMEVAAGYSNHEIAETLCIAPATVRKHLEHTYRKLGVTSRLAAVIRLQGESVGESHLRARLPGCNARSTLERA